VRILVIEDEPKLAKALAEGLRAAGYAVAVANTGEDGFFRLVSEPCDLVVLDWMLPGRSGIEILRAIRAEGRATPVLLLTAKDTVEDRVQGLDAGADDYLVKPFAFPELKARVRALLRRGPAKAASHLTVGPLALDVQTRRVTLSGAGVDLTLREFDLLRYFMQNAGRVVSREMLARDVWEETVRATPIDNVIDVHMARLRKKVDTDPSARLIETVRGVGFRMHAGRNA
jgi:two-component system copper resistance phosphate regulon response regulator CusR